MVVVDTSAFIDLLRGKEADSLRALIAAGLVDISSTVYLELFQGVRRAEQLALSQFLNAIAVPLPWPKRETCLKVIKKGRSAGLKIGVPDIMIVSDALENKARLMTLDKSLSKLASVVGIEVIPND